MKAVFLASPLAGDIEANLKYARRCIRDSLIRNESPYAPHVLLTQPGVLRDEVAEERRLGLLAGQAWLPLCKALVVYFDNGVSGGMQTEIDMATKLGLPIEYRRIGADQ